MNPYNNDKKLPKETTKQLTSQIMSFPLPTFKWQYIDGEFKLVGHNKAAEEITQGSVVKAIGTSAKEMYYDRPRI